MGVTDRLAGGHERARKHLEEIGFRDRGRLFGVIGRHLARIDLVKDLLPAVRELDRIELQGDVVEAKLPFLLIRVVALDAVFLEERPVLLVDARFRCRAESQRGEEGEEGQATQGHVGPS